MRVALLCIALLVGCTQGQEYAQAVCVLTDTSGTYADELGTAVGIIQQGLIPRMQPGDRLIVIRMDSDSYQKENVEGILALEGRPSVANAQKAQFASTLESLTKRKRARYTDIRGGMMLCGEYLDETAAGSRVIVAMSDMKEELPRGKRRELEIDALEATHVVAMNVKRLGADSVNPAHYRERLGRWKDRALEHGADSFEVIIEPERLIAHLEESRR